MIGHHWSEWRYVCGQQSQIICWETKALVGPFCRTTLARRWIELVYRYMAGDARLEWFYTRAAPFFCEAGRSDVVIDDGQAILTFLDQGAVRGVAVLPVSAVSRKGSEPQRYRRGWRAGAPIVQRRAH